jgi:hypothetical protein
MKRIAIIQPSFLPWLGYFEQMAYVDDFVYLDDVQYTKQDWRNRNRLMSPSGVATVTVPVRKTKSVDVAINEVLISYDQPWQHRMIQQISSWYAKARFFDAIFPEFKEILFSRFEYLVDLNYALNEVVRKLLGISTPQSRSSDIPDKSKDKNIKLIEICRHHEAGLLYDGKSAQDFIDVKLFKEQGIDVTFQNYKHMPYRQLWGGFESHLSVLDLLLNCGPDSRGILLASPAPEALSAHG